MVNFFTAIDKFICSYLGFSSAEITPHLVGIKNKEPIIVNTESFKRHIQRLPLSKIDLNLINNENKEKLGIAVGKIMAANLTVSFKKVAINRGNLNA